MVLFMRNLDSDGYIAIGLVGVLAGAVFTGVTWDSDASFFGWIITGLFSVFLQIGVIAKGVQVGYKSYEREVESANG